jgi:hypothetical protein
MSTAYSTEKAERDFFSEAREQAAAMEQHLSTSGSPAMAYRHEELEAYLQREGREWLRRMAQAHLHLRAALEQPVEVRGADDVRRGYARPDTRRPLRLVFGRVEALRLGYEGRGVEALHPLDAALNLPEELYSYGVRRLVAEQVARSSYDETVQALGGQIGEGLGKRQVEELAIRAVVDFQAFYDTRPIEPTATDSYLVLSFDGAGIVMRPEDLRPATQKAAARTTRKLDTRLTRGEKKNRKRMAEVAAIYDVAPFPRTVMDVVHDLRPVRDVAKPRPKPVNKRVWASVERDADEVIRNTFAEALRRDPDRRQRWVVLVDGNKDQIAAIRKAAKQLGVQVTLVLDLMHVLGYLWKAAYCFEAEGSKKAEAWVEQRLIGLLQGQSAGYLAKGMRRNARTRGLSKEDNKPVEDCARYLVNHRKLLHYDRALRDGLPIATGVIEGACRYLVRDRMSVPGEWSLLGAEAILRLRALWTNGDFDAYWAFHLEREYERNHRDRYAGGIVPIPVAPRKPRLRRVK